jgi:hypothetical protein
MPQKAGFGLVPTHSRSQSGDVCNMMPAMPFVEAKLSIQGQKANFRMAKGF